MDASVARRLRGFSIRGGFPPAAVSFGLFLFFLFFPAAGCVTEKPAAPPWLKERLTLYAEEEAHGFEPILGSYAVDPAIGGDLGPTERPDPSDLFGPFHKFARNTYLHDDGTVTLHYYLEPGLGEKTATLLVGNVKGLTKGAANTAPAAVNQVTWFPDFTKDTRKTSASGPDPQGFMGYPHGSQKGACDLLLVRATNQTLVDVEKFIRKFLIEVPLIEVKVRILEVSFSDNTQYGITDSITKETSGSPFFRGLTTHFNSDEMLASGGFTLNDLATWFDPDTANKDPGFQGGFFVVEGVRSKLKLQAALEILQRTGHAEVLSAPKVRVMNGHKAIIETGSDIPIPKAKVGTTSTQYQYEYKPTGVTLVILPILLMDGTLQIQLTSNVTAITGEERFTTAQGAGSVTIPIFSNRGASTVINVKENQAFMLAGLIDKYKVESISKVPLLGDIPLLGFLFKSKNDELRRTQVIFYIEPRVIPPTEVTYGLED